MPRRLAETFVFNLGSQYFERLNKGKAGVDHGGELSGENDYVLVFHSATQCGQASKSGFLLPFGFIRVGVMFFFLRLATTSSFEPADISPDSMVPFARLPRPFKDVSHFLLPPASRRRVSCPLKHSD